MKPIAVQRLHPEGRRITLVPRAGLAATWWSRLRGLIGRPPLQPGEGLWIVPCQQVHTHFMRQAIDIVFLDREGRVLRILPALAPWRLSPWVRGGHAVLELPAGGARGLAEGDRLAWCAPEAA